jgi:SNF2 family DNA or RNA helicase
MLLIHSVNDLRQYAVDCIGKDLYDVFTRVLGAVKHKVLSNDQKWIVDEEGCKALSNAFGIPTISDIGQYVKATLFQFQKESISEALSADGGCLLKLPCGAGKTLIGITLFSELKASGKIHGKGLIVVKASIKVQWPKEIAHFSDFTSSIIDTSVAVATYQRTKIKKLRKEQEKFLAQDAVIYADEIANLENQITELETVSRDKFLQQFNADLLVLNYETLNDEAVIKELKKQKVEFVYADEIHVIKSVSAKRSRSLYKLNSIKYVYGATATPIQKNPEDVYSIYKFLRPGLFKTLKDFRMMYVKYNSFGFATGAKNQDQLNRKIRPFMVIKSQDEVSRELPDLQVIQQYCSLTEKQKAVTIRILDEIKELKEQQQAIVKRYRSVDEARKQSKDMLTIDAQILARQTFAQELADSELLLDSSDSKMAKVYMTGSKSTKVELLLDLIDEIFESGEKVCVFSKYRRMQDILTDEIKKRFKGIKIAYVNGSITDEQRYVETQDKFTKDPNYKVLLMSDAGAEGVNLSDCQYLVEFEPADSYLVQTQRRGRIVRASSTHETVYVYQLVAEGSYDEIALKIVGKKQGFMKDIIER